MACLGPIGAGLVIVVAGPKGFLWYLAMIHITTTVFAIYRAARRAAIPRDEIASGDETADATLGHAGTDS